ncbi:MAG TPA: STAS domain-containing protein [Polyangiaceae bacterium]|jgi:rsbT co-antagonist protein RsbR|nr:STAS domain-containing protein [Polyangiaceae bacterium]
MADENFGEMHDRIAGMLAVLAKVGEGDYESRLELDLPETHPVGKLYRGINDMIASLASAQQRSAAYRKELEEKLATIEAQRAAIRELSTPIIEVWAGVLCMPIVGVMDSSRSADMMNALLQEVSEKGAEYVIIDVTGIEVMDTRTADQFIRTARAVQLLGAECVLTGINPRIAQTIVHMGLDLEAVTTLRSLRSALQLFISRTQDEEEGAPDEETAQG